MRSWSGVGLVAMSISLAVTLLTASQRGPDLGAVPTTADKANSRSGTAGRFGSALASVTQDAELVPAFIENRGQWKTPSRFVACSPGLVAQFDSRGILLQRCRGDGQIGAVVRLEFETADGRAHLSGEDELPGYHNYFLGNDPYRWRTRLPRYGAMRYLGLQPGVDLRIYGRGRGLEYDLLLSPEIDPSCVVVRADGVAALSIRDDGSLQLDTPLGALVQPPPVSWQEDEDGQRLPVACAYRILDETRFTFEVPDRVDGYCTTIDPGLVWSSYVGSTTLETEVRSAVAPDGRVVIASTTNGVDFPISPGAFDPTQNGFNDLAVTVLSSDGSSLLYSTFIGGSGGDNSWGVAVGADGALTGVGWTTSQNLPTSPGAFDTDYSFSSDVFVFQLSAGGDALNFLTYLGGDDLDFPAAMALEEDGSVIVVGETESSDFPVTAGCFDSTLGIRDIFVTRLNPMGSSLIQSTLLGGVSTELAKGAAVDSTGAVVVVGTTASADYPISAGAFDPLLPGEVVTKLNPSLSGLEFSTVLDSHKPGANEMPLDVAIDSTGAVTVIGFTAADTWPETVGAFDTSFGAIHDVFVSRLDPTGSSLLFSTYLGGFGFDNDAAVTVDDGGSAIIVGKTDSPADFPLTAGAFDTTWNNSRDAFVARLSPDGSQLWYGSFLGGSDEEGGTGNRYFDVHALPDGSVVATGLTRSTDFPTTAGAFDTSYNGIRDVFVAKLDLLPTGAERYGNSTAGCAGALAIGVTAMPQIGKPFGLTCTNAPASSVQGILALGLAGLSQPVGAKGAEFWINPSPVLLLLPAASNSVGLALLQGSIPNKPALIDASFAVQFFWPNPCGPAGSLSASNALLLTIQP